MTVYVDDMRRRARVGRTVARWSHLVADHPAELAAFAARLGLRPEWLQDKGKPSEHYDVTDPKRLQALALGAVPMSYLTEMGRFIAAKRQNANADRGNDR
ncbi:DUF4031 domain-containing protein [Streptomyces sp. SID13031]|uniref:DUF4031 domain-containing protein n=1 Tax=Streptomyces sp. SID13031 TaxID=2706046 RepID=UPI0013CB0BDE|nr:DUF4031 domain-containing protein [Streptomyces sp. SID13031]NEA33102.1 DUF4031 domain-containing protein [Streptomyces sp. SID13031]